MHECDICGEQATKDAKLKQGPWAYVCDSCFEKHAVKKPGTFTTLANIGKENREPYSD